MHCFVTFSAFKMEFTFTYKEFSTVPKLSELVFASSFMKYQCHEDFT